MVSLPFEIYFTFVIEEKWGFNKTTASTFVVDKIKGFALMTILTSIFLSAILYTIESCGDNLLFYLSVLTISIIVLLQILVPLVIIPCFYTYSDLEEGKLRTDIFNESEKTKIPVSQIKVIDGSKRSSHSNAFVSGFGPFRKVVIFDTLLEQQTPEEILAVVNHELGHVAHFHIIWNIIASSMQIVFMFSLFTLCVDNKDMLRSFGFDHHTGFLYLFVFQTLYSPFQIFVQFIVMHFTRSCEYQADRFAVTYGHGENLKKALLQLFKKNKGALIVDSFYSMLNNSHPTLMERLKAIDAQLKK